MKIYAIYIVSCAEPYTNEGSIISNYTDFPRKFMLHSGTITETCRFLSKTLAVYCQPGTQTSAEHEGMLLNVFHRADHLICVVFTDFDYPKRVSFILCARVIEQFSGTFVNAWVNVPKDTDMKFKDLKKIAKEFEHPDQHDAIQRALVATSQTTEIITQALNKIIIRGETLQDLVEKSEELSAKAKIFYKESKKKKCCELF